jgi:hypothetical protein
MNTAKPKRIDHRLILSLIGLRLIFLCVSEKQIVLY